MSLTMTRPSFPLSTQGRPSLSTGSSSTSWSTRTLPPLSALLNHDQQPKQQQQQQPVSPNNETDKISIKQEDHAPVSPIRHGSTDLSAHKITTTVAVPPTPNATMQTPIRLPSFDSLKFGGDNKIPVPTLQHSKSFSIPSTIQRAASLPTPGSQSQSKSFHTQPFVPQLNQDSPLIEKRSYAFISHSPSTFPLQEPSIDNAQLARRKRRRTTPRELAILQDEFERGSTPNRLRRIDIANRVDMTEKAVQIWFQNRRQTLRRQSNAEKEVHHIEPVYLNQERSGPDSQFALSQGTPIRHPIVFTSPHTQPPHQQIHPKPALVFNQASSPEHHSSSSQTSPSSPSSAPVQSKPSLESSPTSTKASSSMDNATTTAINDQMVTPSRSSKSLKNISPMSGSTLTFRLKPSPSSSSSTNDSHNNSSINDENTLTPVHQQQRTRQKPVMRVNPTDRSNSPSGKENQSPLKPKSGLSSTSQRSSPSKREPLKQLSFSSNIKPKANEQECVANLMNLRNWR